MYGFPGDSDGKETAMQETQVWSLGQEKIPWRRKWLLTPVFLPGKSHGQRSLAGYSPWGCKKLDMTEQLLLSLVTEFCLFCNPRDCSRPGSSVHGILQARILEWVAIPFPKGSSQPKDRACVSCLLHCSRIIYHLRCLGSPNMITSLIKSTFMTSSCTWVKEFFSWKEDKPNII